MRRILLVSAMALMVTAPTLAPVDAAAQRGGYGGFYEQDHHRRHGDRDHRDNRRERWDRQRHNGYYYRDRFHYGPPPQAYYYEPSFRPAYIPWRRGVRLPVYYRESFYVVRDWDEYDLRRPPRGCHWVRDDRGNFLLVAIATGIIISVAMDRGY